MSVFLLVITAAIVVNIENVEYRLTANYQVK